MNVPLHQQQNKCTTLVKNKTAAATALQFTYPLFAANACAASGNPSLSQAQQEIEATKQTLGGRSKALPEQVWIKVGGVWQSSESSQPNLGEQAQSGPQGGRSQRRERHNRMERDRRRRIRICCDELNLLVPFCNAETDKATTLQWTTAFLKYIQERHGDTLKKRPSPTPPSTALPSAALSCSGFCMLGPFEDSRRTERLCSLPRRPPPTATSAQASYHPAPPRMSLQEWTLTCHMTMWVTSLFPSARASAALQGTLSSWGGLPRALLGLSNAVTAEMRG
ncbi:Transcription factor-like 5 protein [Tupaia chinensis]|uniref:Transcription factor-like 5 protein n=1 Tax=Tupaia chinensis TaxID=246437 RepID=L8Y4G1_TUPCH|nr:Transcription factor-like 5 protein [Tupaia chinensis]